MAISKKQCIAMAVIVVVGLLVSGSIFLSGRTKDGAKEPAYTDAGHEAKEERAAASKGEKPAAGASKAGDSGKEEVHQEGVLRFTDAQLKASSITVQSAGPAKLQASAQFQGEIRFDEDRTTHVVPRVAGVTESVSANLGQLVSKGQVLAVIASTSLSDQRSELLTAQKRRELARTTFTREKKLWEEKISAQQDYLEAQTALQEADIAVQNASQKLSALGATRGGAGGLNRFEVRAPFAGTVVAKHLSLGEAVKEDATIFTVSDLRGVWAEFVVAPKDLSMVRVGQKVVVSSTAFEGKAEGKISYVGALLGEQTRTAQARVTLTNPNGAWRPGLYVTVAVLGEDQDVAVAVSVEALQTIEDKPAIFVATPGGFVATPVQVGRNDGKTIEILSGLKAGDRYAASNTFVLKSELGKSTAEHGH